MTLEWIADALLLLVVVLLLLLIFILENPHGDGTTHTALRRRVIEKIGATDGYEGEEVKQALLFRRV